MRTWTSSSPVPTRFYDRGLLLDVYERQCDAHMTSPTAIGTNMNRAKHLTDRLGDLSQLTARQIRYWQQNRVAERARKTVNLEMDVLRQLLDVCMQQGWRDDNPARVLRKLPCKQSREPFALTYPQVKIALQIAHESAEGQPPHSLRAQLYRITVAGIFFGLRRGELQHLLVSDTNGRQVFIQGKCLPNGKKWVPKNREARVIHYAGIERPIEIVFDNLGEGYVFSPAAERHAAFHYDSLSRIVRKILLARIGPGLTLHSLRHTFAIWRLEQGDSPIRVQGLMGHAEANNLLRYGHVKTNPLIDLLQLIHVCT